MSLLQEPIETIIGKMGHSSPELGGSSGAMLAGQLGLAMIRMALAVSEGREGSGAGTIAQALSQVDRLSAELAQSADADRDAFSAFLEAMKGRAGSSSDDADVHAAELATFTELLDGADLLVAALELAASLGETVVEAVKSDLFGGGALLDAAFAGVSLAIQANLRPWRMAGEREAIRQRLDALDAKRKKAYGLLTGRAGAAGFLL